MGSVSEGYYFEDIRIGQEEDFNIILCQDKINKFAELTGDINPVHIDHEYAKNSRFGRTIAHGKLTASLISTILGTRLPGPGCIFISQETKFLRPVYADDEVNVHAVVSELDANKKFVTLTTKCSVNNKTVLTGKAVVMVPSKQN